MTIYRYRLIIQTYYDDLKAKFQNKSWTEIGRLLIPRGWGRQSFSAGYINHKFIILGGAADFTQEIFDCVSNLHLAGCINVGVKNCRTFWPNLYVIAGKGLLCHQHPSIMQKK